MPCHDYRDDDCTVNSALEEKISFLEAALCATLEAFELETGMSVLDWIDYKEAGITRNQLDRWWKLHQNLDKNRKEEEKKRTEKLIKQALGKLSKEEKKALNLVDK